MFNELLKWAVQNPGEAFGFAVMAVLAGLSVVSSVLNSLTGHWTEVQEFKIWQRRVLSWIERLSVVQSQGVPGLFKLPGFDGKKPPKVPGLGALWVLGLVFVLGVGLSAGSYGCTASQRSMWADLGKGALQDMAPVAADSLCAMMAANCDKLGGDACVTAVTMGCHFGKAKMVKALDDWIKDGKAPDAAEMQLEVRAAIAADPVLMQAASRTIPLIGVKDKIGLIQPGTKAKTSAAGGAGATDSKPLEVK